MTKKYNLYMSEVLKKDSLDAFEHGHYLQSAIIIFQTVETLLRVFISVRARSKGIKEKIRKKISEDEKSFYKLVLYLNLLDPNNILLKRLYSLGKNRNGIMHNLLFEFKDIDQYKKTLEDFCLEGVKLNEDLRKMMGVD